MKKVWVRHLAMGDAIVLAGAVVWLLERGHGEIIFPCRPWDRLSIEAMFADYPQVEVRPVSSLDEMLGIEGEKVCTGLFNKAKPYPDGLTADRGFDAWFYHQLGIPIEAKWDCFPLEFDAIPADPGVDCFLHEDIKRGYTINHNRLAESRLTVVPYPEFGSIFDWAGPIIRAKRVDVINSAFLHLCEVLPLLPERERYLHRYPRGCAPVDMPKLRHHWEILD